MKNVFPEQKIYYRFKLIANKVRFFKSPSFCYWGRLRYLSFVGNIFKYHYISQVPGIKTFNLDTHPAVCRTLKILILKFCLQNFI